MNSFKSRLVTVPDDLATVRALADNEQPATSTGLDDGAVQSIWAAVEALYRTGITPAIGFCLRHRGKILLNRTLGHAQGKAPADPAHTPILLATPTTPIMLCSASKAITAALVHLLAEDGGIDLDRSVAHYLPAFGANGKQHITIAQMLAHRGGVPFLRPPRNKQRTDMLQDWARCVQHICAAKPAHKGHTAYHAYTSGFILGEIIQRVTERPLRDYLDKKLRQPLGMQHFTYGLPTSQRAQVAHNAVTGQPLHFPMTQFIQRLLEFSFDELVDVLNSEASMDGVMPSGNLYTTAEELSRFYQTLLDNGRFEGRQIFAPATVERMLHPVGHTSFDRTVMLPLRYSEGLMLGANPYSIFGPNSARVYGHLGFTNTLAWADPNRELVCSLLVTGKAVFGPHLGAFFNLLNTIARECKSTRSPLRELA